MNGGAAGLEDQDVRPLLGDQLPAGPRQHAEGDLVRHRRRREEERALVPQQFRRPALQLVDGRILLLLLVTDLGGGHRRQHLGGRLRSGVGPQIDHGAQPSGAHLAGFVDATSNTPTQGGEARPPPSASTLSVRVCPRCGNFAPVRARYRGPVDLTLLSETPRTSAASLPTGRARSGAGRRAARAGYEAMTNVPSRPARRNSRARCRSRRSTVESEARVARRHRQGALPHRGRPPGRGGADALPRRPALDLRLVAVGLPADVHVLRDRADAVRPQPDRSEILDQALHFRRIEPVDHCVFMGMGEPMLNLDAVLRRRGGSPTSGSPTAARRSRRSAGCPG